MKRLLIIATATGALLLGACDKKGGDAEESAEAAKPAPKAPAELFASKAVELPAPLAKIEFGATKEDALAAVGWEDSINSDAGYADTTLSFYAPKKLGTVQTVTVEVKGKDTLEKLLTKQWGEPKRGTYMDKPKLYWFNPEKGVRAILENGYDESQKVEFSQYLPLDKLLGADKKLLGFETKTLLGMNRKQIQDTYKDVVKKLSKKEAEAQRKRIEKMMGKKLDVLGDPTASIDLELLPTEYGSYWTRVHPYIPSSETTVQSFRLSIPYDTYPAAKDEILKRIQKKYGEGVEEADSIGRKSLVLNQDPRVFLKEDKISKAWEINVEFKKP